MKRCPTLLITCPHGKENRAIEEVSNILFALDYNVKCEKTKYPGVLTVYSSIDPREAASLIRRSITSYVFRVVPIDACVPTSIDNIVDATLKLLGEKNVKQVKFYVDCTRRGRRVESSVEVERKVGTAVANTFNCIVDFESPDLIVKIEIVDEISLISILKPEELIVKRGKSR